MANGPLAVKSNAALVVDQETQEVLFRKNDQAVLPIASITKLMTGVLISEAKLPMDETITITQDDVDTEKGSSRLSVGTELSRGELLHLALMSSENRAAHALGRTYPGAIRLCEPDERQGQGAGYARHELRRTDRPSTAGTSQRRDLATLVNYAYNDALLRELSTSPDYQVAVGNRMLQQEHQPPGEQSILGDWPAENWLHPGGRPVPGHAGQRWLVASSSWCSLDSAGKLTRIADAERVRRWVESSPQQLRLWACGQRGNVGAYALRAVVGSVGRRTAAQ